MVSQVKGGSAWEGKGEEGGEERRGRVDERGEEERKGQRWGPVIRGVTMKTALSIYALPRSLFLHPPHRGRIRREYILYR